MLIPSARANLIRSYQNALFYKPTEPKHERQYVFYILLRPILSWVKETMVNDFSLEPEEAESELYLLCCRLFDKFDKDKSTLVPYLKKHLPWKVNHLIRKLNKYSQRELPAGLTKIPEEPYKLQEEYYWKIPDLLTTDKFVKKLFTKSLKYYIYKILASEDDKLTKKDLSKSCGISRPTMIKQILELQEVLSDWRK